MTSVFSAATLPQGRFETMWDHVLAWFQVNDRVKLIAYRVCDPNAAPLLGRSSSPLVARLRIVSNPSALGR